MISQSGLALDQLRRLPLTVFVFLLLNAHNSFANITPQAVATEEAYFLLEEISSRKDLFVVKVTGEAQVRKAREAIAGTNLTERFPIGKLVKAPACYNPGWSYHIEEVRFITGYGIPTAYRLVEDGAAASLIDDIIGVPATILKELPKPDCTGSIAFHVSAASYKRGNLTTRVWTNEGGRLASP